MRKRCGILISGILAMLSLAGASSASAATEVGNECTAVSGASNYTFVQINRASANSFPLTVPVAGVVTKWKVSSGVPIALSQRLRVFRATGNPAEFTTVAESSVVTVGLGVNNFEARIPVQAGDRFGASGGGPTGAPLYCSTANPADTMGALASDAAVGSTNVFPPAEGLLVAVSATVEPDADNDGFGDETQDKCPQSAALQTECPVVVVDSFPLLKKGKVVVLVATSTSTNVTVSGSAKLPKGSKASSSAQAKLRKVTKAVTAGKFARFTLNFPGALKSAVAGLAPGKSITLKLQATTTDVAGRVSQDKAKLKLKG